MHYKGVFCGGRVKMNKIRLGIADDNKDFCDILIDFFNAQENIEIVFVAHERNGNAIVCRKIFAGNTYSRYDNAAS